MMNSKNSKDRPLKTDTIIQVEILITNIPLSSKNWRGFLSA